VKIAAIVHTIFFLEMSQAVENPISILRKLKFNCYVQTELLFLVVQCLRTVVLSGAVS